MSGISLTSSMRNNLLSLQQTAKLQDLTQNRLATGLKVNSAIDNPSSYYTAQSLNNRAEDLNILLDAMSQGIQTLKAVNESIEAGTKFLEQAKSAANAAFEVAGGSAQPIAAKVHTEEELLAAVNSGQKGLIVLMSDITMSENQNILLKEGQSLVGASYLDKNAPTTSLNFSVTEEKNAIVSKSNSIISNLDIKFTATIDAPDVDDSILSVLKLEGSNIFVDNVSINTDVTLENRSIGSLNIIDITNSDVTFGSINLYDSAKKGTGRLTTLGIYGEQAHAVFTGNSVLNSEETGKSRAMDIKGNVDFIKNATFETNTKFSANNITVQDNAKITTHNGITYSNLTLKDSATVNTFGSIFTSMFTNTITLEGRSQLNVNSKETTRGALHYMNLNIKSAEARVNLNSPIRSFSNVLLKAVSGATIMTTDGIFVAQGNQEEVFVHGNDLANQSMPTQFVKTGDFDASVFPQAQATNFALLDNAVETADDADKASKLDSYSKQFNQILNQYDSLINDSWYKGVNLLKQQDLKVVFNENRTSDLEIKGVNALTSGLGLELASWNNATAIQDSLNQIDNAINQLRLYASEFGNYYQIVTTRENFTNSLINVLTEGADALTLADMNQESANMLALQTRQQLAVNSLSLASQASQSVLKLF